MEFGRARQLLCGECGNKSLICTRCDRGQRYCSLLCRRKARSKSLMRARKKHRSSYEGRLDHRDAERLRRMQRRRTSVADHSSKNLQERAQLPSEIHREDNDAKNRQPDTSFGDMEKPEQDKTTYNRNFTTGLVTRRTNSVAAFVTSRGVSLFCSTCGRAVVVVRTLVHSSPQSQGPP